MDNFRKALVAIQRLKAVRPEYLIAIYLDPRARTHKRLERVASLLEETDVEESMEPTVSG